MSGTALRVSYLLELVHDYRAQGVVFHSLKFCDQYQYDYPLFKKRLEEEGIPVLRIETDYQEAARGQLAGIEEAFSRICGRRAGKERLEAVISSSNRTRLALR